MNLQKYQSDSQSENFEVEFNMVTQYLIKQFKNRVNFDNLYKRLNFYFMAAFIDTDNKKFF